MDHFEYTPEMIIFDLVGVHLYHGWLVEPQSSPYCAELAPLSYNLLAEKIIAASEELPDDASAETRKEWEATVGLGEFCSTCIRFGTVVVFISCSSQCASLNHRIPHTLASLCVVIMLSLGS